MCSCWSSSTWLAVGCTPPLHQYTAPPHQYTAWPPFSLVHLPHNLFLLPPTFNDKGNDAVLPSVCRALSASVSRHTLCTSFIRSPWQPCLGAHHIGSDQQFGCHPHRNPLLAVLTLTSVHGAANLCFSWRSAPNCGAFFNCLYSFFLIHNLTGMTSCGILHPGKLSKNKTPEAAIVEKHVCACGCFDRFVIECDTVYLPLWESKLDALACDEHSLDVVRALTHACSSGVVPRVVCLDQRGSRGACCVD